MDVDLNPGTEAGRGQSADRERHAPPGWLAWAGGWGAVLALAEWMSRLSAVWLLLAVVGSAVWGVRALRRGDRWSRASAVVLWAALGLAGGVQYRLWEVAQDWAGVRAEVEERSAAALNAALDELVVRGERAVTGAAAAAAGGVPVSRQLFARLDALHESTGVSAVAVFEADSSLLAWAGEHRGMVPAPVRSGDRGYVFHEGPLFSYLYFVRPLAGGRTAVATVLLEANLAVEEGKVPFAESFAERHGLVPRFTLPARAQGESVWDWSTDRPILSVSFATLTQQHWWERVVRRGRLGVGALWLAALLLINLGWYRRHRERAGVLVLVTTVALLLLPLGSMLDAPTLFSPIQFVLVGPWDVTLGMLLILLAGLGTWVLTRGGEAGHAGLPIWAQTAAAAVAFPAMVALVHRSAANGLLASHVAGGIGLQSALVLLIAIPLYLLARNGRRGAPVRVPAKVLLAVGLALPLALGVTVVLLWHPERPVPVLTAALWAVPFALVLLALRQPSRRSGRLLEWLLAGWLASTAALAHLWPMHMAAELGNAERELAHLGTETDPFLDFLLRQFAEQALHYAREGEEGVNLLYHSWVASGLAGEGYEARLSIWSEGQVEAELRLSDRASLPGVAPELIDSIAAGGGPIVQHFTRVEALHYLLLAPLPGGRVVSVAVPPRQQIGRSTALARFLHPRTESDAAAHNETLVLIPAMGVLADAAPNAAPPPVDWTRTVRGWRGESGAHFPAGWMHVHLFVRTANLAVLLVRAILVQTALLALFLGLWATARLLCGDRGLLPAGSVAWARSFRGRLTATLFVFFLLPTAVFGAAAYGAVAREVVQSAAGLAQRTLEQAAPYTSRASLAQLGAEVSADLLLYQEGTLVNATAPEVLDLGLFHTWLPPGVYLDFAASEDVDALEESRLGGSDYLIAYRRLNPRGVLAVPIPLASEEITRRQREFRDIALLMSLLGAGLSVFLSLQVGRTLARPIDELSRAAATVGAGDLRVRLPEDRSDEFGTVYHAFNQMVSRLRRARAAEVRSARVLAWGEMARQVAHEIKNPLTPIKLSVQHVRRAFLDQRPDFGEILERNVEAVLREIERLGEIARAFSRFGTPAETVDRLEPVDVPRIAEETLALYRSGSGGIRYRMEVAAPVPPATARVGELKEVLVNLLENAREALDGDGEIAISVAPAGEGRWVEVVVADNGEGIPTDLLPRVFEPHFSTRTSGTGLGLAIVRRLVESWGGEVSASSEPGEGTRMRLLLPVA